MKNKLIIVGKSCSGKDFAQSLLAPYLKFGCWHTTRPPRDGEIHGYHYYFVNEQQWNLNKFLVVTEFNGWKYGLTEWVFNNSQAIIGNLKLIDFLFTGYRSESLIMWLNPADEAIFNRCQMKAMPGDNWERRYCQDRIDFDTFIDWDIEINNPCFNLDDLITILKAHQFIQ